MASELQIQTSAFTGAVTAAVQSKLYQACLDPVSGVYVDHLDVVVGGVVLVDDPGPDIQLIVPIDVYALTQAELEAAEDPPQVAVPKGRVVAEYTLTLAGAVLLPTLADLRAEPANPLLDPLLPRLMPLLPALAGIDLGPMLTALRQPQPQTTQILVIGDLVVLRFDPVGPPSPHLFAGQDWGVFLDGPGIIALIRSFLPPMPVGTEIRLDWDPVGAVPRVAGRIVIRALPNPFGGSIELPFSVALSVVGTTPARIRATLTRGTVQLHLDNVPGILEDAAEGIIEGYVAQLFNPAAVGGTKVDDRSFFIDSVLPPLSLEGADLRIASLVAEGTGMTLGGTVRPVFAEWTTLNKSVHRFGLPTWSGTCRQRGGNPPPKTLKITDVTSGAGVNFSDFGAFCGATAIDASGIAAAYLNAPSPGPIAGNVGSVGFSMPATVAAGISSDVKLILRTARGVRMINLGRPVIKVDDAGNVEFISFFLDDCLTLTDDQLSLIEWMKRGGKLDRDLVDPPFEDPSWQTLTTSEAGFEVQMVSLRNLIPGELVSFRSADHAIDVTADVHGRVMVPVFMPLSEANAPMKLERVNRQSVAGNFRVEAAVFRRGAQFAAGEMNMLEVDQEGRARLTRRLNGRDVGHALGVGGGISQAIEIASAGQEVSLNPQPLPPEPPPKFLAAARQLQGFRDLVLIPGFEEAPIAVARMKNGAAVLLQDDGAGSVRVAGSFKGPIGAMSTVGNWAIGVGQDSVTAFQVERT